MGVPRMCRTALCFVLVCVFTFGLAHRSAAQTPDAAPAAIADPIDTQIRELLPDLADREKGAAALEKLQGLRDTRVLLLFQRIADRTVFDLDKQFVFVPANQTGETVSVYDLLVAVDEAGLPQGDPVATVPPATLKGKDFSPQRAIRTQIVNALRVLGLRIDDPAVRRNAARELGNRRQAETLEELDKLAQSDPDADVRLVAAESAALIRVADPAVAKTPEARATAMAVLGEMKSLRSFDLLKSLEGKPELADVERAALSNALSRIERHRSTTKWLQTLFSGISLGSIYVLLALGLAITFGAMGVINMAHGEMMMIGAITTWACYEFISPLLPAAYFDWYYVIAFPAAFLMSATIGLLIEVSVVRHLYKRPLDSLLATIGISYILIQAVRLWKGDNLGMRGPGWAGGNWEILQDVVLPYNRLFLICLSAVCVLSVIVIFRYTKIGLRIRATVQNREMAQAMGVNTRLVDMFTFAFGAGLAGLAGYGIVLTSNPTPEMGQTYIVKTFLTVVVGGVGKLAGVIVSGLGLGSIEKFLEPIVLIESPIKLFDATWAQVAALIIVILFMQRKPAGLFPDKGRMADQADTTSAPLIGRGNRKTDWLLGTSLVFLGLILVPLLYGTGLMSLEFVNKLGYITAFAICAIGLDLIWGYIGVLSLCQFLFFSIGGYCMGLYLINYGPMDGPDKNIPRALFVVMSAVSGAKPPWFLDVFHSFPVAVLLGMLLPGLLALVIGLTTFRSRVKGVYFSILTQAITVAFWLMFQKNDLKLGGTNGLTNFTHILGYPIQADATAGRFEQTRFWLYIVSCLTLLVVIVIAKVLVHSGFGRVLVAIRDDETRLRFVGYQTWAYKMTAFAVAAIFAGIGGMLYVPQKGIITPHQIAAGASILVVAWVAVGGRGTLWGAVIGAIGVSLIYDWTTSVAPEYWYFVLGGLFVIVPLLFPGGVMSIPAKLLGPRESKKSKTPDPKLAVAMKGGAA